MWLFISNFLFAIFIRIDSDSMSTKSKWTWKTVCLSSKCKCPIDGTAERSILTLWHYTSTGCVLHLRFADSNINKYTPITSPISVIHAYAQDCSLCSQCSHIMTHFCREMNVHMYVCVDVLVLLLLSFVGASVCARVLGSTERCQSEPRSEFSQYSLIN